MTLTSFDQAAYLAVDWPAPENVRAVVTTRKGGVSEGDWASFNLAQHVGDRIEHVEQNRQRLHQMLDLPVRPFWLSQVHGVAVVDAQTGTGQVEADGSYSNKPGVVCTVMTADCLPVLLTDSAGEYIAAAHAGWRGLLNGVIEAAVDKYPGHSDDLLVWLGPAIGPNAFEVGAEVREAFCAKDAEADKAFTTDKPGRLTADIYQLARMRLQKKGVKRIYGGDLCTFTDAERFYSYRRDGQTGRMASLIWRVS